MTIHEAMMWMVECDHPGCDRSTSDVSEWAGAWAQRWCAADVWADWGGVVMPDGVAWCDRHIPDEVCSVAEDRCHRWEVDEERTDALHSMEVALLAVACGECGAERDDGQRCPTCGGTGLECRVHQTAWLTLFGPESGSVRYEDRCTQVDCAERTRCPQCHGTGWVVRPTETEPQEES